MRNGDFLVKLIYKALELGSNVYFLSKWYEGLMYNQGSASSLGKWLRARL